MKQIINVAYNRSKYISMTADRSEDSGAEVMTGISSVHLWKKRRETWEQSSEVAADDSHHCHHVKL